MVAFLTCQTIILWEANPIVGYAPQAQETIGSCKLLGIVKNRNKTNIVELIIKYECHILFTFACNSFSVHH